MTFLPLTQEFTFFDASGISGLGFLLVLCVLAFLAILVWVFSKFFSKIHKKESKPAVENKATQPVTAPEVKAADAVTETVTEKEPEIPYTPGYVTLDGISEQDAAVVMAITSFRTGIELERLAFRSIKRLNQDPVLENVSEQDAAVIMAITSDKTGIPLENLAFNSIKLVEE